MSPFDDEMETARKNNVINDAFGTVVTNANVLLRNFCINEMVFYRIDWFVKALFATPEFDATLYIAALRKYLINIESAIYCEDDQTFIHENLLPNCIEFIYLLVTQPDIAVGTRPFVKGLDFEKATIDGLQEKILKIAPRHNIYNSTYAANIIAKQKQYLHNYYGEERTLTYAIYRQRFHYKNPGGFKYYIDKAEANLCELLADEMKEVEKKQSKARSKRERKILNKEKKEYPYDIVICTEDCIIPPKQSLRETSCRDGTNGTNGTNNGINGTNNGTDCGFDSIDEDLIRTRFLAKLKQHGVRASITQVVEDNK